MIEPGDRCVLLASLEYDTPRRGKWATVVSYNPVRGRVDVRFDGEPRDSICWDANVFAYQSRAPETPDI